MGESYAEKYEIPACPCQPWPWRVSDQDIGQAKKVQMKSLTSLPWLQGSSLQRKYTVLVGSLVLSMANIPLSGFIASIKVVGFSVKAKSRKKSCGIFRNLGAELAHGPTTPLINILQQRNTSQSTSANKAESDACTSMKLIIVTSVRKSHVDKLLLSHSLEWLHHWRGELLWIYPRSSLISSKHPSRKTVSMISDMFLLCFGGFLSP